MINHVFPVIGRLFKKRSKFAGHIPHKLFSFRHLGVESSAQKLPEERESENPQNVVGMCETNTVETGETSTSPANGSSILQDAAMRVESIGAELGDEDRNLTMAEKDCALTSGDDDVEDLSAFVNERLRCSRQGSVEKLMVDETVNLEEILCENVGVGEDGVDKSQSMFPSVTINGDVGISDRWFSPGEEISQTLR